MQITTTAKVGSLKGEIVDVQHYPGDTPFLEVLSDEIPGRQGERKVYVHIDLTPKVLAKLNNIAS